MVKLTKGANTVAHLLLAYDRQWLCIHGTPPNFLIRNHGSGCGTVGRAVASYTRDTRFESQHWQNIIYQLYNIEKTEISKKMPGLAH